MMKTSRSNKNAWSTARNQPANRALQRRAERPIADIDLQLARAETLGHRLRIETGTIQPKLTLGPADDAYEREADQVSRQVMASLASPAPIEESPEEIEQAPGSTAQAQRLQRSTLREGGMIDADIEASINRQRSGGRPLDGPVRTSMESAFGADFGGVKVHTGSQSDQLNRSLEARAFTTGQDIFFRQGEYQPSSSNGQQLLAHELTHVVQQNGPNVRQG